MTNVIANNSTNNNVVLFFVSDFKIVCHKNYQSLIRMLWIKKDKYFASVECSLMARETWIQSQVESYQRLKKWYLVSPCLTLSIIRYVKRVKWSSPRKGVLPFPIHRYGRYWKGGLRVALYYGRQLYLHYLLIWRQNHSKPINMIMIYYCDKKPKKWLYVWKLINNTWKNIDLKSEAQRIYVLQGVFQMTAIVLFSE